MNESNVGASILNIITESLYDKPIVVFREYVQNSVDSLRSTLNNDNENYLFNHIWNDNGNLYFLDNGSGIVEEEFVDKMQSIALSEKNKLTNIGYKGIGRLAGISYCKKLHFVNIIDYKNQKFQEYIINCDKYNEIQKSDAYNEMNFLELMNTIGTLNKDIDSDEIFNIIANQNRIFQKRNSGFLVIMERISSVLKTVIDEKNFEEQLCWLLPVPFRNELLSSGNKEDELFQELSFNPIFDNTSVIAAQSYKIFLNNKQLFRPLTHKMFRTYLCKSDFDTYAVCIHSFSNEKIELDRKNAFSGMRIYIDNMLLCDEGEIIPILQQYGFLSHGLYEVIQAVRGVGVIIYIVDKVNISANARRTFIELTDSDALNFLELLASFVEDIYDTRYALSKYASAIKGEKIAEAEIEKKRLNALNHLEKLAREEIEVTVKVKEKQDDFDLLEKTEQKRIIKGKITKEINEYIKQYLNQTDSFNLDTCITDFKTWFLAN